MQVVNFAQCLHIVLVIGKYTNVFRGIASGGEVKCFWVKHLLGEKGLFMGGSEEKVKVEDLSMDEFS